MQFAQNYIGKRTITELSVYEETDHPQFATHQGGDSTWLTVESEDDKPRIVVFLQTVEAARQLLAAAQELVRRLEGRKP